MSSFSPLSDLNNLNVLDYHTYHSIINPHHSDERTLAIFQHEFPSLSKESEEFISKIDEERIRKGSRHVLADRTLLDYCLRLLLLELYPSKSQLAPSSITPRVQTVLAKFHDIFSLSLQPNERLQKLENLIKHFNSYDRGNASTPDLEIDRINAKLEAYSPNCIYFFNELNLKYNSNIFTFSIVGNLSASSFLDPCVVTNLPNDKFNYYPTGLMNSIHFENYLHRINVQLKLEGKNILLICRNNVISTSSFSNIELMYVNISFDKYYYNRRYVKFPDEYGVNYWMKFNFIDQLCKLHQFQTPSLILNSLLTVYRDCTNKLLHHPIYNKFYQMNIQKSRFLCSSPVYDTSSTSFDHNYALVSDIYVVKNEVYDNIPTSHYNNIFKYVSYNYTCKDVYSILEQLEKFGSFDFSTTTNLDEIILFLDTKLYPYLSNGRKSVLRSFNPFFSEFVDSMLSASKKSNLTSLPGALNLSSFSNTFTLHGDHFAQMSLVLSLDNKIRFGYQSLLLNDNYVEDNLFPQDHTLIIRRSEESVILPRNNTNVCEDPLNVSDEIAKFIENPTVPKKSTKVPEAGNPFPSHLEAIESINSATYKPVDSIEPDVNRASPSPALSEIVMSENTGLSAINSPELDNNEARNYEDGSSIQRALIDPVTAKPTAKVTKDKVSISPNKFFNKVYLYNSLLDTSVSRISKRSISEIHQPLQTPPLAHSTSHLEPSDSPSIDRASSRLIGKATTKSSFDKTNITKKRKNSEISMPTVKKSRILEVLKKDKLFLVADGDSTIFSDDSDESDNSFDPTRNERIKIKTSNLVPSKLSHERLSDLSSSLIEIEVSKPKLLLENASKVIIDPISSTRDSETRLAYSSVDESESESGSSSDLSEIKKEQTIENRNSILEGPLKVTDSSKHSSPIDVEEKNTIFKTLSLPKSATNNPDLLVNRYNIIDLDTPTTSPLPIFASNDKKKLGNNLSEHPEHISAESSDNLNSQIQSQSSKSQHGVNIEGQDISEHSPVFQNVHSRSGYQTLDPDESSGSNRSESRSHTEGETLGADTLPFGLTDTQNTKPLTLLPQEFKINLLPELKSELVSQSESEIKKVTNARIVGKSNDIIPTKLTSLSVSDPTELVSNYKSLIPPTRSQSPTRLHMLSDIRKPKTTIEPIKNTPIVRAASKGFSFKSRKEVSSSDFESSTDVSSDSSSDDSSDIPS